MNLRRLSDAAQYQLTRRFTEPPVRERVGRLAGGPSLLRTFDALKSRQEVLLQAGESEVIKAISAEGARLLERHSQLMRALPSLLRDLAAVARGEDRRAELLSLLDQVAPPDLSLGQRYSFQEAADRALALQHRLGTSVEQRLRAVRADDRSLWDAAAEMLELGRRLGELQRKRNEIGRRRQEALPRAGDARGEWTTAVHLLVNAIELSPDPASERDAILGELAQPAGKNKDR